MSKLKWIACNGVKPDLPEDAKVHIIFREYDKLIERGPLGAAGWRWDSVICYALEPVDLVKELVDAAKVFLKHQPTASDLLEHSKRLVNAVRDVEDMK